MKEVCNDLHAEETLLYQLERALLDTEAKAAAISNKRNVIQNFEREIKKAFYRDADDAADVAEVRFGQIAGIGEETTPEDLWD